MPFSTPSPSTCLDINTVNVSSSLHGIKILNTDSLCFSSTKTSSTTSHSPSHDINTVSVSSRLHGMKILNTDNLRQFSSTTTFSMSCSTTPPSTSLDINTVIVSSRFQGLIRDDGRKVGVHSSQWTLRDFLVS